MLQNILQFIIFLSRASLAAVLVAAGAAKLADIKGFTATLRGLGMPDNHGSFTRGVAFIISLVEVVLGIALVSGLWPTIVNVMVLVLYCSFTLVVIIALSRRVNVACRCFGMLSDSQFSSKGLIRSVLLTLLALVVFLGGRTYSLQFDGPPIAILLLVAGFLLFGLAAWQAAKSIAVIKERMA